MNEQLIKNLKKEEVENANLSPYEKLTELSKYMNRQFNGNRLHDVEYLVTFYNYTKNNDDYSKYSNQYKNTFSRYLDTTYSSKQIVENDFDEFVNKSEEFLDTFIDLSSNELAQRVVDIAKDKTKNDSNYLGLYNKIGEIIKKYDKKVNIDYSFINDVLNNTKENKEDAKIDIDSALSGVQGALNDIDSIAPIETPKLNTKNDFDDMVKKSEEKINNIESDADIKSAQSIIGEQVNDAKEKINQITINAKKDHNLGYSTTSSNENTNYDEENLKKDIDLGSFNRPNINSNSDYKSAISDIKSKIHVLNMEQRALEKENQKRIDNMVDKKADELGVSKEKLEKYINNNNLPINEIDNIVISPTMESQFAANEAIAQLPKTKFMKLVDRLFASLKLRKADLEIEVKEDKNILNVSLDTSKAQKISSMEKKIYDKLIKSSERRKNIKKWFVDTKNNVKNAIKNVISKLKETDSKNKERISSGLHNLADRIYMPDSNQVNNEYEVSVFDLLNKLNGKQIIGKEGSQVGEIENPELQIEESSKKM